MNTLINQPAQPLNFQTAVPGKSVRRSCLSCNYIGETPDVKCPNCGKIPLMKVSTMQMRGVMKIVWGMLTIVIVAVALLAIAEFSLWNKSFFGNGVFHGDPRANILAFWGMFLAVVGGVCEIVLGTWYLFYSKPQKTLAMIKPLLRLLYIVTGVAFVILNRLGG